MQCRYGSRSGIVFRIVIPYYTQSGCVRVMAGDLLDILKDCNVKLFCKL